MSNKTRKHRHNKHKAKTITRKSSYSPTINKQLVTLKSIEPEDLVDCNSEKAFKEKEPLQIKVHNKCQYYYTNDARHFLLKNLSANKHINPKIIVPPMQHKSNCWFNAMFVTFFVSDKGRKFFHFLRQLMIEGKQQDDTAIPERLRDGFALLNYAIDACLTGNKFAYEMDTNSIIHSIYKSIPESYKKKYRYIVDVDKAGNPLLYYIGIINYLHNKSLEMAFITEANYKWKNDVKLAVQEMSGYPHIIVVEIYDDNAAEFHKPAVIHIHDATYQLDSAVVRDIDKQHFCALITCEKKEYGYDGASFHRLVPQKWKRNINRDKEWGFEGVKDYNNVSLKWNFAKSYQLLIYYRIK